MVRSLLVVAACSLVVACNSGPKDATPEPVKATPAPIATATQESALRLGAPIDAKAQSVALSEVAKAPNNYVNKSFTTTGTVTAVCQHMGCWMEIKDDASLAHIKMAGHKFFVPKTASGKKARIQATLVPGEAKGSCEGEGHAAEGASAEGHSAEGHKGKGCREEAEEQLGHPLAKLELVADGVEIL